jgi:hypothetical protein
VLATVLAVVLLAAAIVLRRPIAIPAVICMLAAPYVVSLAFETDQLDTRAPLIAGLLFAVAELAYWSLELRGSVADEPGTYLRRIALLSGLVVGTFVAGTAVLVLVEVVAARGVAIDIVGAVAAAGAIALLAVAARAQLKR